MARADDWEPGVPSWVDLSTTDVGGAVRFYTRLFGWGVDAQGPDADHAYLMLRFRDRDVAGLSGFPPTSAGEPRPAWTTYISTADIDDAIERVEKAGGAVTLAPIDVTDAGRMALCNDSLGAVFALWHARNHHGAGLVNEPGAMCWNELNGRDADAAIGFYGDVFGWTAHRDEMSNGLDYIEFQLDGRVVAGFMPHEADVASQWLAFFAVVGCDKTVDTAAALGASVLVPPTDAAPGRFALLADPQGAEFAVIALAS
jgi:hypothetical protein